jgi:prepilin-type processing-associated H-X9-DG protein
MLHRSSPRNQLRPPRHAYLLENFSTHIIAILAAILFPVFARARAKAFQNTCLSNIKQIGLAERMYESDNDDRCPLWSYTVGTNTRIHWTYLLYPYTKNDRIYVCPSQSPVTQWDQNGGTWPTGAPRDCSYSVNGVAPGGHWGSCNTNMRGFYYSTLMSQDVWDVAQVIMFFDYDSKGSWACAPSIYQPEMTDVNYGVVPGASVAANPKPAQLHMGGYNAAFADGHAKWLMYGSSKYYNWAINYIAGGGC